MYRFQFYLHPKFHDVNRYAQSGHVRTTLLATEISTRVHCFPRKENHQVVRLYLIDSGRNNVSWTQIIYWLLSLTLSRFIWPSCNDSQPNQLYTQRGQSHTAFLIHLFIVHQRQIAPPRRFVILIWVQHNSKIEKFNDFLFFRRKYDIDNDLVCQLDDNFG